MRDARRGRDSAEGERESTKEMAWKMQDHISYNMAGSIIKKKKHGWFARKSRGLESNLCMVPTTIILSTLSLSPAFRCREPSAEI